MIVLRCVGRLTCDGGRPSRIHRMARPRIAAVSCHLAACWYGVRLPLLTALVLIVQGASARFERSLLQRIAGLVLSSYPLPADNAWVNQFFNLLFGHKQKPGPLFEFVTRQCWQTDQSVMAHRFRLVVRNELAERLPQICVPTLVLSGNRDLLVSERSLRELCSLVPQAELVRFRDCGHLAFVTDPRRVAEETTRFLCPA